MSGLRFWYDKDFDRLVFYIGECASVDLSKRFDRFCLCYHKNKVNKICLYKASKSEDVLKDIAKKVGLGEYGLFETWNKAMKGLK